jgi:hypothetical protein
LFNEYTINFKEINNIDNILIENNNNKIIEEEELDPDKFLLENENKIDLMIENKNNEEFIEIISDNLNKDFEKIEEINYIKENDYNKYIINNIKILKLFNNNEINFYTKNIEIINDEIKFKRKIIKFINYNKFKKNIIIYLLKLKNICENIEQQNFIIKQIEYFNDEINILNNNEFKQIINKIKNIEEIIKKLLYKIENKIINNIEINKYKNKIQNYIKNDNILLNKTNLNKIDYENIKVEDLRKIIKDIKEEIKIKNNYLNKLKQIQEFNFYIKKNKDVVNELIKNYNKEIGNDNKSTINDKLLYLNKLFLYYNEKDHLENDLNMIKLKKEYKDNKVEKKINKFINEVLENKTINENMDVNILSSKKKIFFIEILALINNEKIIEIPNNDKEYIKPNNYNYEELEDQIIKIKPNKNFNIINHKKFFAINFSINYNINLYTIYFSKKGFYFEMKNENNNLTPYFLDIFFQVFDNFNIFNLICFILYETKLCGIIYNSNNLYKNELLIDNNNNIIGKTVFGLWYEYKKDSKQFIEEKFIISKGKLIYLK